MPMTNAEIINLTNPYEVFSDADNLAEHQKKLNLLNPNQKHHLATKILLGCPEQNLRQYGRVINAIKDHKPDSFYKFLYNAHLTMSKLHSILDPRNPNPHDQFSNKEFTPQLFHEFPELTQHFFDKENTSSVVTRLALQTPVAYVNEVVRNFKIAFPNKEKLLAKINGAFTLRREIKRLLGDNPETFFTSPEVNEGLCHEFSEILVELIKGQEEAIGLKLAQSDPANYQALCSSLEKMNLNANDETNPLRTIVRAMLRTKSLVANDKSNLVKNTLGEDTVEALYEVHLNTPPLPLSSTFFKPANEIRQKQGSTLKKSSSDHDHDEQNNIVAETSCCSKLIS